jgi:hypothetical protein
VRGYALLGSVYFPPELHPPRARLLELRFRCSGPLVSRGGKRGSTVLDGVNFHSWHVALLLAILAAVKKAFFFLGTRE